MEVVVKSIAVADQCRSVFMLDTMHEPFLPHRTISDNSCEEDNKINK